MACIIKPIIVELLHTPLVVWLGPCDSKITFNIQLGNKKVCQHKKVDIFFVNACLQ
jgi:hypothetical protein